MNNQHNEASREEKLATDSWEGEGGAQKPPGVLATSPMKEVTAKEVNSHSILNGNHMAHDPCATCGGSGSIQCSHCDGGGINRDSGLLDDLCPGCHGTGLERCPHCRGTGEWRQPIIVPTENI